LVGGLLSGALAVAILQAANQGDGRQAKLFTGAIDRGVQEARAPVEDRDAAEDEALSHDANEAGYRWAERHGVDRVEACPAYSKAFLEGCAAYAGEQRGP
jgi:hypothetical protein